MFIDCFPSTPLAEDGESWRACFSRLTFLRLKLKIQELLRKGFMLLYWGMFTMGFTIGAVFSFITLAVKKPEEDAEYL